MTCSTTTIDERYELTDVLGRGGMGEVWAARDLRLQRDVAVKLLSAEMAARADVRGRFEAEARSMAGLSHPNIVPVYDTGEHEGRPYLVMERLPPRTLGDEIADGPLSPERARAVGVDVLAGLEAAHAAGIVHRDIKPANILLCVDGSAKVADFGIAKATSSIDHTTGEVVLGTPGYLAPERLAGEPATASSDIYAVGVLLYEAITGVEPFPGEFPLAQVQAVQRGRPRPLADVRPDLPAHLVTAIERAMDADPVRRFRTAREMADALGGRRPQPRPRPERRPVPATERLRLPMAAGHGRRKAPLLVLLVAVVVLAVAVTRGLWMSGPSPATAAPAPLPAGTDSVPAGRYHSNTLAPGVAFTLGGGWVRGDAEAGDVLALRQSEAPGSAAELSFVAVQRVFPADQRPASGRDYIAANAAVPPPGGLIDWLRRHPGLRVSDPTAASVGGVAGVRVDVRVASGYPSEACSAPCVVLFQLDADPGKYRIVKLEQGKAMRMYAVERDGRAFVAVIVAPVEGFEASAAAAESVVKSVAFQP